MLEETQETVNETKTEFILTDALREKASKKPIFNILHVTNEDSRLSVFRGRTALKTFVDFYERQAEMAYMTATSSMLSKMTIDELCRYNILWIDNVSDMNAINNLSKIHYELLSRTEPDWKEKVVGLGEDGMQYLRDLNEKRANNTIRIIYAIDEFVWEGPVGRAHDINTVKIMESFMEIADVVVVPTATLKEAIQRWFVSDPMKQFAVIPTVANLEFFPLLKNFVRGNRSATQQILAKPKVLVKGTTIPKNVQEFIAYNCSKIDITICSVGELDQHIIGLINTKKVGQIYHWANPHVNRRTMTMTYALERDGSYDFVIHCKPDNVLGDLYEITSDVDDIILTIASGAIPITGLEHIGYDKTHLAYAGIVFDKDTTAKKLRSIIDDYSLPVRWNEAFTKARNALEHLLITSPQILKLYFMIMCGKDLTLARREIAKEGAAKIDAALNQPTSTETEQTETTESTDSDKIIAVDFTKGNQ